MVQEDKKEKEKKKWLQNKTKQNLWAWLGNLDNIKMCDHSFTFLSSLDIYNFVNNNNKRKRQLDITSTLNNYNYKIK